jgi:hypothetical protein
MNQQDTDASVRLMLSTIDSALLVLDENQFDVDWAKVLDAYPRLSSGEQAVVDVTCHLSGRRCFHPDGFPPLLSTIGRMDEPKRRMALIVLASMFNDET